MFGKGDQLDNAMRAAGDTAAELKRLRVRLAAVEPVVRAAVRYTSIRASVADADDVSTMQDVADAAADTREAVDAMPADVRKEYGG